MKKIIAGLAVLAMGACVFAGSLALTVDAVTQYSNGKNSFLDLDAEGLSVQKNDDLYDLQMIGSYESSSGGAAFRIRNKPAGLVVDRWDVNFKPADWVKVGMGNYPIELFCESVKWEPIAGAGMFENAPNKFYTEFYPTGELTLGLGFVGCGADWYKTVVAYAQYSIPMVGRMAFEVEMNDNAALLGGMDYSVNPDGVPLFGAGEAMRAGFQFEYNGTDNLDLIASVAPVFGFKEGEDFKFVQLRFDLFGSFAVDAFSVEAYNAFILPGSDEFGKIGDRFGVKAAYAINDVLTPWFRANFLYNYSASWGFGYNWGTVGFDEGMGFIGEAMLGFNLGNGVTGDIGAEVQYKEGADFGWRIPLHIVVGF